MPSKPFLFSFIILIFLIPLATARTEHISSSSSGSLEIDSPLLDYVEQNTNYTFRFQLYNRSNGIPIIDNMTCYFYLYNSTGNQLAILQDAIASDYGYDFLISSGNFSSIGNREYNLNCNRTTEIGGFVRHSFEITKNGREINKYIPIAVSIIVFTTVALLFVISFTLNEKEHIGLKFMFLFASLLVILVGSDYGLQLFIDNSASAQITTLVSWLYRIAVYMLIIFTVYWLVYYIYILLTRFKNYGN